MAKVKVYVSDEVSQKIGKSKASIVEAASREYFRKISDNKKLKEAMKLGIHPALAKFL